jgi:hypothetical protein
MTAQELPLSSADGDEAAAAAAGLLLRSRTGERERERSRAGLLLRAGERRAGELRKTRRIFKQEIAEYNVSRIDTHREREWERRGERERERGERERLIINQTKE